MAAPPVLRTWTVGELATAAMLNANVRDPGDFFLLPPFVLVTGTADQSISNNTWTLATWNDGIDIAENMFSGSGGVITIRRAGVYALNALGLFQANATGGRGVSIDHITAGGTRTVLATSGGYSSYGAPDAGQGSPETAVNVSDPGVSCAVGDTLEMYVYQNSGGALNLMKNYSTNIYSYFAARWVAS